MFTESAFCAGESSDRSLSYLLPVSSSRVHQLQREDAIIPVIYDQMLSFLKKLGNKFIKASNLKAAFKDEDMQAFPYMDKEEQLSGMQVYVSRFIILHVPV